MYICNIYCYLYCISLYVCTCFNKLLHPFPNFLAKDKEMRAGYRCLHSTARLLIQLEMDLNEIFTKDWSWPNVVNTWSWSQSSERFFGMMLWHCRIGYYLLSGVVTFFDKCISLDFEQKFKWNHVTRPTLTSYRHFKHDNKTPQHPDYYG